MLRLHRTTGQHPLDQLLGQQDRGGEVVGDSFQLLSGVGALVGPVQQPLVALAEVMARLVEHGEVLPTRVWRRLIDDLVVVGDGKPVAPSAEPAVHAWSSVSDAK